jgi:hypothetical protein
MKNYTVRLYEAQDFDVWNTFISTAKNATFLFHRDFMEYHSDRFQDYSLLVFDEKKLVAVLPANRVESTVYSHQGLTYGGLVLPPKSKFSDTIYIFKAILKKLNENQISNLFVKELPNIYSTYASDELDYLIHICKGKLKMKHAISIINLNRKLLFSRSRNKCIKRGKSNNLIIKEETNISDFWNTLLIPNLNDKYQSKPVHSLEEISFLMEKFPMNIRHFNVYYNNNLVCGSTLFITKNVIKPQYIAGNDFNNELGSIDFLYDFLINEIAKEVEFFDLGPSHVNNGLQIIQNINFWKESFGAQTLSQDFYEVETKNYYLLDTVLL